MDAGVGDAMEGRQLAGDTTFLSVLPRASGLAALAARTAVFLSSGEEAPLGMKVVMALLKPGGRAPSAMRRT
eukprot:7161474-Alexandrium_andersonii.AAC.1